MNINSANPYSIQGAVISIGELSKSRPGMVRKMTEDEINAFKVLEEQTRLADLSAQQQLEHKSDNIYGQVLVNGKVFATVYESGGAEMLRDVPGLNNEGFGLGLAKTRLEKIAQAVKGEIKHSDFLPTFGGRYAQLPETNPSLVSAQRKVDQVLQAIYQGSRFEFLSSSEHSST